MELFTKRKTKRQTKRNKININTFVLIKTSFIFSFDFEHLKHFVRWKKLEL